MSDPTGKPVKIVFEGDASGAQTAAQQAGEALEGVKAKAGQLNETVSGEGAPDSQGIPGGVRGLHMALRLIAREAGPAAGAAIGALAAATTGGMLAAILAVHELFDWLHKAREKAEQLRAQQDDLWQAIQSGAADAATSQDDFNRKLAEATRVSDGLQRSFEARRKLLDDEIAAHEKLLAAIEKVQLAEAAGDKDKQAAIKARFDQLRQGDDLEGQRRKITLEQHQRDLLLIQKGAVEDQPRIIQAALDTAIAQGPVLVERLKRAREDATSAGIDVNTDLQQRAFALQQQLKQPGLDQYSASLLFGQLQKILPVIAAQSAVDENKRDQASLQAGLTQALSDLRNTIMELSRLLTQIGADKTNLGIAANTAAAERLLNQPFGPAHETLGQLAAASGKNAEQTENILQAILDHTLNITTVMAQMHGQIQQQKAQIEHLAQHTLSGS